MDAKHDHLVALWSPAEFALLVKVSAFYIMAEETSAGAKRTEVRLSAVLTCIASLRPEVVRISQKCGWQNQGAGQRERMKKHIKV